MEKQELKSKIAEAIASVQGCKGTEVPSVIWEFIAQVDHDIPTILEEMVKEGMIVEVEYTVPNLPDRLKSFYLPTGSSARIVSTKGDSTESRSEAKQ